MPSDVAIAYSDIFLEHVCDGPHPENPDRIAGLLQTIASDAILSKLTNSFTPNVEPQLLRRIHEPLLVDAIMSLRGKRGWINPDTCYGPRSVDAAIAAVGSTASLAQAIWRGQYRRGFSLIRPPGHHATPTKSMGFCLFNNVSVAAAAILAESPKARLAIVDFDLHHGNGTQDAFYENPQVLFISSHRFPYYPGTGALAEIGRGKGLGTTMNLPIPRAMGDEVLLPIYRELVWGAVAAFRPEMILVSAGYDGHVNDPMAGLRLSSEFFDFVTELLLALAELTSGKILFCLEGGYNPDVLTSCVVSGLHKAIRTPRHAFTPEPVPHPTQEAGLKLLEDFRGFHASYFPEL